MKRPAAPLVDYASDDDHETPPRTDVPSPPPPVKKRKLPALSSSLKPSTPVDNPALHQGRIRTAPYIEGQYAAYVYVPVILEPASKLLRLVRKAYKEAKKSVPILHPIDASFRGLKSEKASDTSCVESAFDPSVPHELHVSLSRPIFLRAHQRDELTRAVRSITLSHSSFSASFAIFSNLTNDEQTRIFLTLEVGAGHTELSKLSAALTPHLQLLRQKSFYSEPRFHASFAWALLSSAPVADESHSAISTSRIEGHLQSPSQNRDASAFPTIPALPVDLVPKLNSAFASQLASPHVGSFEVTEVCVKIGKVVSRFKLGRSS
ncbi:hypothetical protein GLOTRDRAFT_94143 [Gloeophyllum trabeum ATCC 11539]|uniref:U6 snRNA phosphodiesterase 1 n=1 Tax=Gloeophyllum trabeum (strain ATCC 11539 / FP-39264 / Madison 617) TaxID=670483 RepID=S7Q5E9_GLOTA|nr:uncharacterized protein GLOTRDRAFT_94143 [Gloeophyllum trabeum ATCC 11539]EPQ54718.1 hypothetical protein GLOTRDRAFT_94143 [Gloeophyllum trabeum ATCC 11539]